MSTPVYLDFNASTPVAPEVAAAMRPLLESHYGNPSSTHWAGQPAHAALAAARAQVAALLGCSPDEIVFTSGGGEANNLAIKGAFFDARGHANHIVTTRIESPATLQPCRFLERFGAEVTYMRVDGMLSNPTARRTARATPTTGCGSALRQGGARSERRCPGPRRNWTRCNAFRPQTDRCRGSRVASAREQGDRGVAASDLTPSTLPLSVRRHAAISGATLS